MERQWSTENRDHTENTAKPDVGRCLRQLHCKCWVLAGTIQLTALKVQEVAPAIHAKAGTALQHQAVTCARLGCRIRCHSRPAAALGICTVRRLWPLNDFLPCLCEGSMLLQPVMDSAACTFCALGWCCAYSRGIQEVGLSSACHGRGSRAEVSSACHKSGSRAGGSSRPSCRARQ